MSDQQLRLISRPWEFRSVEQLHRQHDSWRDILIATNNTSTKCIRGKNCVIISKLRLLDCCMIWLRKKVNDKLTKFVNRHRHPSQKLMNPFRNIIWIGITKIHLQNKRRHYQQHGKPPSYWRRQCSLVRTCNVAKFTHPPVTLRSPKGHWSEGSQDQVGKFSDIACSRLSSHAVVGIFMPKNNIVTEFSHLALGGPVIMPHRVLHRGPIKNKTPNSCP